MKNKRFIRVLNKPATWIEVANEISAEKAKEDFMRKQNRIVPNKWTGIDYKRKFNL